MDAGEGVEEGLGPDAVAGAGPGHDLVEGRVVEGEGDVGGVEGDEAVDDVRVRVGFGVEEFGDDVDGGAGEVLRGDVGGRRGGRGVAAVEPVNFLGGGFFVCGAGRGGGGEEGEGAA